MIKSNLEISEILLQQVYDGVYIVDEEGKIIYWNPSAEKITGYKSSDVLGRKCSDGILVHVDDHGCHLCEKDCPLKKTRDLARPCECETYFRHREGHRVPVYVRTAPIGGEGESKNIVSIFRENTSGKATTEIIEELRKMTLLDELTGISNRRYIEKVIMSRLEEIRRYNETFGVLFLDIDNFKKINDSLGHDVGDKVIQMVSKTLSNNLRQFDVAGRWGGEEFVAIILNTNSENLYAIAEKLRSLIEQSWLPISPDGVNVTVSIGAAIAKYDDTRESLLKRADSLMYKSKQTGKNRTTMM